MDVEIDWRSAALSLAGINTFSCAKAGQEFAKIKNKAGTKVRFIERSITWK
jgi:hypothetical protein